MSDQHLPPPAGSPLPPPNLPPPAAAPGATPAAVAPIPTGPPPPTPPTESLKAGWKQPWVIVIALIAVVGVVVGVIALTGGDDEPKTTTVDSSAVEPGTTQATTPDGTVAPTVAPTVVPSGPLGIGASTSLTSQETRLDVTLLEMVDPAQPGEFFEPDPGNKLVAVRMRIVNSGSADYQDSPSFGAVLIDSANQQYTSSFLSTELGPDLGSVHILPNDVRSGWVVFEVAQAVAPSKLQWTPDSGFADDIAQWDLGLPAQSAPVAPAVLAPATAVGDAISLSGSESKVSVTVMQVVDPASPAEFSEPRPGYRLVAVQLSITNDGTTTYEDSPGNSALVIDSDGQQHLSGYFEVTSGPGFDGSVTMPPGDTRVGFVVFEVPDDATVVKMQMALDYGYADEVGEFALS